MNPPTRYRLGPCARCRRLRPLVARHLCDSCYHGEMDRGRPTRWPRATYGRDELMGEWEPLSRDHTIAQAAARLGMTAAALDRAVCRARKAGDPRALRPRWGSRTGVLPTSRTPGRLVSA